MQEPHLSKLTRRRLVYKLFPSKFIYKGKACYVGIKMRIKKVVLSSTILALMVLMIPSAFPSVFACGKVTGGGHGKIGETVRTPAGSFGFNAMWFSRDPAPKGELQYVDHITGMKVHAHDIDGLWVHTYLAGNKPWPYQVAEFWGPCTVDFGDGNGKQDGYGFYVYVQDKGEPGTSDTFYIWVDVYDGSGPFTYEAGSMDDPILCGNIQIHKPPK